MLMQVKIAYWRTGLGMVNGRMAIVNGKSISYVNRSKLKYNKKKKKRKKKEKKNWCRESDTGICKNHNSRKRQNLHPNQGWIMTFWDPLANEIIAPSDGATL